MNKKREVKKIKKLLKIYLENGRFRAKELITETIHFRLSNIAFSRIANCFEVSRTRIFNIEKSFLNSLNKADRNLYKKIIKSFKEGPLKLSS